MGEENQAPLLETSAKTPKTPAQKAIRKTFKLTAHLANLLPTGTVLTFQVLSPILTHQGQCPASLNKPLTLTLILCCGISCFFLCFTDSFRDERGKVRYGIATRKGLWVIDGAVVLPQEEAEKYQLRLIDFFHAFMTMLVFFAVTLFDQNVVKCFYPNPSKEDRGILLALPVGIGVICSILFVRFPSKRHGIGFPLSRH